MMFVTFGAHGYVNALKGDTITAIGPKYLEFPEFCFYPVSSQKGKLS